MADPDVTLTRAQYESLVLAAEGDTTIDVALLKKTVDRANSITRYVLNIRWQDVGGTPPTRIEIANGTGWPAEQTFKLVLDRAISREDVDDVLETQATSPVDPAVTRDPDGIVGWTLLDDYDFINNAV
jgi:hypothetical protein